MLDYYDFELRKNKFEDSIKSSIDTFDKYDKGKNIEFIAIEIDEGRILGSIGLQFDDMNVSLFQYIASVINYEYSETYPGIYKNKNDFLSIFASVYYYNDIIDFVTKMYISIINNHPFHNGNKRTALNFMVYFLDLIGVKYVDEKDYTAQITLQYLMKDVDEKKIKNFLRTKMHLKSIKKEQKCNFESLISRESYYEDITMNVVNTTKKESFTLEDLKESSLFYKSLTKPSFQRDTNDWNVDKAVELIRTFFNQELIPAIIMWRADNGKLYVLDGAHRLSALIAWVNNKYDSSTVNSKLIEKYVDEQVGSFKTNTEKKEMIAILATNAVHIQWVTGSYEAAKNSFVKINEQGVVISKDEKEMIKDDKKPTVMLARHILSYGNGQNSPIKNDSGKLIYDILFEKNQIFPLLGRLNEDFVISKVYSLIKMIDDEKELEMDELSSRVYFYLNYVSNVLNLCNRVYFYGISGKHKPNSVFSIIYLLMELEKEEKISLFIDNRQTFEETIAELERDVQLLTRKHRTSKKTYKPLADYYRNILVDISQDNIIKHSEVLLTIRQENIKMKYLNELSLINKCSICGGYLDNGETHNICQ